MILGREDIYNIYTSNQYVHYEVNSISNHWVYICISIDMQGIVASYKTFPSCNENLQGWNIILALNWVNMAT